MQECIFSIKNFIKALQCKDLQKILILLQSFKSKQLLLLDRSMEGALLQQIVLLENFEVFEKVLCSDNLRDCLVNQVDSLGKTALYTALAVGRNEDIIKYLITVARVDHLKTYTFLGCSYMDLIKIYHPGPLFLDLLEQRLENE
jgi:hypothetical protein